jgi:IS605 OrfB family transposase
MKLTAQIKLVTSAQEKSALEQTLRRANEACDYMSQQAWEKKLFKQFNVHTLCYHAVRKHFPDLSAQIVVRCIAKVADAYKVGKKVTRTFKPLGAISYDERILHWYTEKSLVSIWTVAGRMKIPFVCGERQRILMETQSGQSDLVYRDGEFYLYACCEVEDPEPCDFDECLGVDLGIVSVATDSDGTVYSGATMNGLRARHRRLRQKLQKKNTKSAKRLLKKRARKEHRFATNENHRISKQIVQEAKDTKRAIALEELTGIRSRTTVRKKDRATHHSWAFFELRSFIEYKAKRAGVTVIPVNPAYTSRTCPICGCVDKKNRPSQSVFSCIECGFSENADFVAALNIAIRGRAVVNQPNADAA